MSSLIVEVCKVEKIEKHPNADKLSIVNIKGWSCIVGLDQYKIGDLVIYCPPDSIIPTNIIEKNELEYLRKDGRVKSVKLRGYLSEGLILDVPKGNYKLGDDVASVLGITKYEPPEPKFYKGIKQTSKKKLNPNFDRYTDIENIKNYNDIFTENDIVVITEKIHGSNARYGNLEIVINNNQPFLEKIKNWIQKYVFKQTHQFVIGSHNVQITANTNRRSFYSENIWEKIATKYDLKNKIPKDYIVCGEIYGKGIQDLTYGLENIDLVIFDIKYKSRYQSWEFVKNFCNKNNLKYAPELYIGKWNNELIKYNSGNSTLCNTQITEGCVIKMLEEENHPKIGRKILKSINVDYLLRKGGTEFK